MTPTFFRWITPFSDSLHHDEKTIVLVKFLKFAFTIHMESNCCINTGVRDLEVAFFKLRLILPEGMTLVAKIY